MDRKEYQRQWHQKNRTKRLAIEKERRKEMAEWFADFKSTLSCTRCPEKHIATLDFHHLDPTEKEAGITKLVHGKSSKERILSEMAKCIVLCSNCHRKLHYDERNGAGSEPRTRATAMARRHSTN